MPAWLVPAAIAAGGALLSKFGGGGREKEARGFAQEGWEPAKSAWRANIEGANQGIPDAQKRLNQSREGAMAGYSGVLNNPYGGNYNLLSNMARTGGIDDTGIQGDLSRLRAGPTNLGRMRGGGVYEDLAAGGGIDIDRLTRRAAGSVGSGYEGVLNSMRTGNRATGGFDPGFGSRMRAGMADASRGVGEAAFGAEADARTLFNATREQGARGMFETESEVNRQRADMVRAALSGDLNLQGLRQHGMLGGMGLLGDADRMKLAASQGIAGLSGQDFNELFGYYGMRGDAAAGLAGGGINRANLEGSTAEPGWLDHLSRGAQMAAPWMNYGSAPSPGGFTPIDIPGPNMTHPGGFSAGGGMGGEFNPMTGGWGGSWNPQGGTPAWGGGN